VAKGSAEEQFGLEAEFDAEIFDGGPSQNSVDGDISTKSDAKNGWGGVQIRIRQVITDDGGELSIGVDVKVRGIFQGTD
jgi:hypothetical protein